MLFAATAAAAGPRCPERPIKLALYEAGLLYTDGIGFDKDFAETLRQRSGCAFDIVVMPRARIFRDLEDGELDMTTSVLPTPEREAYAWLLPYFKMRNYMILPKPGGEHYRSLQHFRDDPKKPILGRVRSYKHGELFDDWIDKLATQGRVQELIGSEALFKMLKAGRIDAMVTTPMSYRPLLLAYEMSDKVVIRDWGGASASSPRGLGLSRRRFDEAEARQWQQLIDAMRRDGTIKQLLLRHLNKTEAAAMLIK